jgi:inorganic pyrophosphatase
VVVEIPRGGRAKFEIDPKTGTVWLDRVLSTATQYPAEYGFILDTASGDGDPLDAVVLIEERTVPGCHLRARPIGVLPMADEAGPDSKVLCVALGDPSVGGYADIDDVTPHLLEEIEHFFRVYKQLEPDRPVVVGDWLGAREAERLIQECTVPPPTADPDNPINPSRRRQIVVNIELDHEQSELLREVLDSAFRDLRYEVADTDNTTYKQGLRSREAVLASILAKLGGPLPDRA